MQSTDFKEQERARPSGVPVRQGQSPPNPLLLPQLMSPIQREWFETRKESLPFSTPAVHVVIRVPPGGESYHVYLLDARDEEMRVVAEFERKA